MSDISLSLFIYIFPPIFPLNIFFLSPDIYMLYIRITVNSILFYTILNLKQHNTLVISKLYLYREKFRGNKYLL